MNMFDESIARRKEHALVPVLPPNQVRRRPRIPMDLKDQCLPIHISDVMPPNQKQVSNVSSHEQSPQHNTHTSRETGPGTKVQRTHPNVARSIERDYR